MKILRYIATEVILVGDGEDIAVHCHRSDISRWW